MKSFQLIATAGIAVASIVGFAGVAAAASAASTAGVACVNGDGVMDVVVTNPATDAPAEFVITNPATFVASVIELGPGSSQVLTIDGLADGSVVVPVQFNGTDASVSAQIACDPPACADGVLTTITDDNGVQQQACVAVAAEAPPAANPVRASLVPQPTPTNPARLPTTGAGTGGLVIAALLVGSGSIASLVSRRKADRH